jgi:hypothetical protein
MNRNSSPSIINLILTVLVLLVVLVYAFLTLSTQDPLWMLPTFSETPDEIQLNCYGEMISLIPEDPEFSPLVAVINEKLSESKNYDSLTLSDSSYQEYQETDEMMVMELFYSPPVRIHSIYRFFSNLDSIIIPLDGRHARTNAIFGRANGLSTAGSLHFPNIPDIRAYVESTGICP